MSPFVKGLFISFLQKFIWATTQKFIWSASPTKWPVHPEKTQISLGIRPVWSESLLSAWRNLGPLATHWAQSEDSDQTGQMLIWVFSQCWPESSLGAQSFCWFCHEVAHMIWVYTVFRGLFYAMLSINGLWGLEQCKTLQNDRCIQFSLHIHAVWSCTIMQSDQSPLSSWWRFCSLATHRVPSENSVQTTIKS